MSAFQVFATVAVFVAVVFVAGAVFVFKNRASIAKEVAREAAQGDALVAKVQGVVAAAK